MPRSLSIAACGFSVLAGLCQLTLGSGCHGPQNVTETLDAGAHATTHTTTATALQTGSRGVDAGKVDSAPPPKKDGPYLGALYPQTPVFSEMEWPKKDTERTKKGDSVRVGYLRQGEKTLVKPEPHMKSNCSEGWYELEAGGYVCGKYATLDLNHPKFRLSTHPPFDDRPMPYEYGYNVANGTPLYRAVPSHEERAEAEPWLAQKRATRHEKAREDSDGTDEDAGVAETAEVEAPWYMRDYDGGKPQVTLEDLRGEGPVARRMVKGFFLALDKPFVSGGVRWWRTTDGLIAPADRIMQWKPPTEYKGIWLDERAGEGQTAPKAVGFVLGPKAKRYNVSGKHVAVAGDAPRFTIVRLTGQSATIGGQTYEETESNYWIKLGESTMTEPGPAPADLAPGEKWVDVNLTRQTLVLFEGDKQVYATLVSTGKRSPLKEKDHPTVLGSFRIRDKHVASTMDGDVASDGPYSIEDVPWVMYFQGSYALHGAFWHGNFGHVQSHGCVNLSPSDAKAIFGWTEPLVPEGWHGASATAAHPGTRVIVHD